MPEYQAFYFYALIHEIQIDIGSTILIHMELTFSHHKKDLPYGNLIFDILDHKENPKWGFQIVLEHHYTLLTTCLFIGDGTKPSFTTGCKLLL